MVVLNMNLKTDRFVCLCLGLVLWALRRVCRMFELHELNMYQITVNGQLCLA